VDLDVLFVLNLFEIIMRINFQQKFLLGFSTSSVLRWVGFSPAPNLSRQLASLPDERIGDGERARLPPRDVSPSPGRIECARRIRRTSTKQNLLFFLFYFDKHFS
jgi:hypothetical protein